MPKQFKERLEPRNGASGRVKVLRMDEEKILCVNFRHSLKITAHRRCPPKATRVGNVLETLEQARVRLGELARYKANLKQRGLKYQLVNRDLQRSLSGMFPEAPAPPPSPCSSPPRYGTSPPDEFFLRFATARTVSPSFFPSELNTVSY